MRRLSPRRLLELSILCRTDESLMTMLSLESVVMRISESKTWRSVLAVGLCWCSLVFAQQLSTEEGLRLAPSTDLGSRGNTDYVSSGVAPISIRSSPLPAQQSIKIDAGQRVELTTQQNGAASGGRRNLGLNSADQAEVQRSRTEFQQFIYKTRGKDLEHFGRNLFGAPPSTFILTDRIAPPADYVLAPGDEVRIRAWGQVDIDFVGAVERNGVLYIPVMGSLNVVGMAFKDLAPAVRARISRSYKSFELDVTLGQIRMTQVFVTGQANKPGSYALGGLTTMVNAVFAVGGPSDEGSMRRIELRRGNKVINVFDMYEFLISGDKSKDVRLQSGDVLHFPPINAQAAIAGSVKNAAIFELVAGDTLETLIAFSGGLSTVAGAGRVIVERIDVKRERQMSEFALSGDAVKRFMQDGDVVQINPVSARFENAVTVRGYVNTPQRLPHLAGMRVSDAIPGQLALQASRYWEIRNARGRGSHWLLDKQVDGTQGVLKSGAQIVRGQPLGSSLPSLELDARRADDSNAAKANSFASRSGSRVPANDGGSAVFDDDGLAFERRRQELRKIDLLDDLQATNVDVNWTYALIERIDSKSLKTRLIPFDLARAIMEKDPKDNHLLEAGDIITVFSTQDLRVPITVRSQFVKVDGEVLRPGIYQITAGETLAQLIQRVGGVSANAYVYGAEFTREDTREFQQREYDLAVDRLSESLERSAAARLRESLDGGSGGAPDSATGMLDAQRRLVRKLRSVPASGRIVLDRAGFSSGSEVLDVVLEDGDRFYLPARPSTVSVVGAVNRPNALLFRAGRSVKEYLGLAGGVTKDGLVESLMIIRANGAVQQVSGGAWFSKDVAVEVFPGDTLVVPENTDSVTWRRVMRDWTNIVYQGSLGVAGIRLLNDVLRR